MNAGVGDAQKRRERGVEWSGVEEEGVCVRVWEGNPGGSCSGTPVV